MNDLNADTHFFELDALEALPLNELQTLWESVPTEEQAYLARVFEREASKRQIVEDADEAEMAQYFLQQYRTNALVPAGDVWLKVPAAVREHYKQPLSAPLDAHDHTPTESVSPKAASAFPRWLLLLAMPMMCMFLFAGVRVLTRNDNVPAATVGLMVTPSRTPSPTPTPTLTPTAPPPTPTPFALAGFDAAITAGERPSRDYYPVQLQVFTHADAAPRVFIVQQQEIEVAEWRFDRNPDVVSWLGGMLVRPVLGVPFDAGNLDLFLALNPDSRFVVTMNTGNVLEFVYQHTQQITRAETRFFRQDAPGLVLVLIGETFADGAPTDLRYLVEASYPAEQEVARLQAVAPLEVAMGIPTDLNGAQVQVTGATWLAAPELPPDLGYVLVDVQITSGETAFDTGSLNPRVAWLPAGSDPLAPDLNGAAQGTCAPFGGQLPPHTAACLTLAFVAPPNAQRGLLYLNEAGFALEVTPPELPPSAAQVDVQLQNITVAERALTVNVRLFNPQVLPVTLHTTDFALVLGFIPDPTGVTHHPAFEPATLAAGAALDVTLTFPYGGEGFGLLTLLERVYRLEV